MVSLQQMQYIVSLYEHGQFQRASEVCFVTQPTLSMQVKKAEEILGNVIFDRSRKSLELTSFGESVIPVLRDILYENDRLLKLSQKFQGRKLNKLKIGIIPTISSYLIEKIIGLNNVSQDLNVSFKELTSHELLRNLEDLHLDLIIMAGPFFHPSFQTVKLYDEELRAYFPLSKKDEVSSEELFPERPWLLSEGNCLRSQMISFCNLHTDRERETFDFEGGNLEVLMQLTDQLGGYTIIPEYYLVRDSRNQNVRSVRINSMGLLPGRTVIAVYRKRSFQSDLIEELLRGIKSKFPPSGRQLEIIPWKEG